MAVPRRALPPNAWRVARALRCDEDGGAPRIIETLEDTPCDARSLIETRLCGEQVAAMHESLSLPRLDSAEVRLMLHWRMPRRA